MTTLTRAVTDILVSPAHGQSGAGFLRLGQRLWAVLHTDQCARDRRSQSGTELSPRSPVREPVGGIALPR